MRPARVRAMEVDRNGLEVLDREECLRLLGTATLGRIALTDGALPVVLPVNFRVAGDRILVRTSRGTKLDAATRNAVVAFEVDHVDPMYHSGWSVVVTGVAADVETASEQDVWATPRWATVATTGWWRSASARSRAAASTARPCGGLATCTIHAERRSRRGTAPVRQGSSSPIPLACCTDRT